MLVWCDHCHKETEQVLVSINSSRMTDKFLLTKFRCHECWKYNYSTADRPKYDTKKYPYLPRFEIKNDSENFVMIIDPNNFIREILDDDEAYDVLDE